MSHRRLLVSAALGRRDIRLRSKLIGSACAFAHSNASISQLSAPVIGLVPFQATTSGSMVRSPRQSWKLFCHPKKALLLLTNSAPDHLPLLRLFPSLPHCHISSQEYISVVIHIHSHQQSNRFLLVLELGCDQPNTPNTRQSVQVITA